MYKSGILFEYSFFYFRLCQKVLWFFKNTFFYPHIFLLFPGKWWMYLFISLIKDLWSFSGSSANRDCGTFMKGEIMSLPILLILKDILFKANLKYKSFQKILLGVAKKIPENSTRHTHEYSSYTNALQFPSTLPVNVVLKSS